MMDSLTLIIVLSAIMLIWFSSGSFMNRRIMGGAFESVRNQLKSHVSKLEFRGGGSGFMVRGLRLKGSLRELELAVSLLPRETIFSLFSWLSGKRDLVKVSGSVRRELGKLDAVSASSPFNVKGGKRENDVVLLRGRLSKDLEQLIELGVWRIILDREKFYLLMPLKALERGALKRFLEFLQRGA